MVFGSIIRKAKGFRSAEEEKEFQKTFQEERIKFRAEEEEKRKKVLMERARQAARQRSTAPLGLRLNPQAADDIFANITGQPSRQGKKMQLKKKKPEANAFDQLFGF